MVYMAALGIVSAAAAAPCRTSGSCPQWLAEFERVQWNNALVYSTTAAYLATRIAGAPPLHRGNAPPALAFADIKALQSSPSHAGYDVGAIDRFLGLKTRQAVKAT
jgi:hypothetical protein